MDYLQPLYNSFESNRNAANAVPMAKYMKNHFSYLGIKRPERNLLQREFFNTEGLPEMNALKATIKELWRKPEREYQYFALDILAKLKNKTPAEFIELYKFMIIEKSWWDTVDLIASQLVGSHLQRFPELIKTMDDWSIHENLWLRRTAILYQLKYKDNTDTKRLETYIECNLGSTEFFINKAIGWILREYGKTNPSFVVDFVESHPILANLSKKEALRIILKK